MHLSQYNLKYYKIITCICNQIDGIVHCEWNDWIIGDCSKSCAGGNRTNTRTQKVAAEHGGDECEGDESVQESCNVQECPGHKFSSSLSTILESSNSTIS